MRPVRKAVIPAAGLGTRFIPLTKAQPKEMLSIVDRPVIQYVVEEAVAAGIEDILIVTGRGKRAIEDHFDRSLELELHFARLCRADLIQQVRNISDLGDIHFVRQKMPLGLGHAILQARRHVGDEPFAILLPDEIFTGPRPCIGELIEQFTATSAGAVVAVHPVPPSEVRRYGVVDAETGTGRLRRVRGLVEKPDPSEAPSNLAVAGRYVIDPAIFPILADLPPGRGGEVQLTDALDRLARRLPMYAYEPEAQRHDVGEPLGYIAATVEFALARPDLGPALRSRLRQLLLEADSAPSEAAVPCAAAGGWGSDD